MPGSMRTPLEFFIILVVILNLAIVIVCFVIDANLTGRHLGHNKEIRLLVPFCLKCLHRVDAYKMRAGILRGRNGTFMKAVLSLCLFILIVDRGRKDECSI